MIYQSVFGWISTILSIACFVWVIGLLIFVLIKSIINKVKAKKDISKYEKGKKNDIKSKKGK